MAIVHGKIETLQRIKQTLCEIDNLSINSVEDVQQLEQKLRTELRSHFIILRTELQEEIERLASQQLHLEENLHTKTALYRQQLQNELAAKRAALQALAEPKSLLQRFLYQLSRLRLNLSSAKLEQAKQVEDQLRQEFYDEVDGGGGTGYRGVGEVAKAKETYLLKAEALREEKEVALVHFSLDLDSKLEDRLKQRVSIVDDPGILRKSEAIFRVAFSNAKAAALFIAITLILFSLEATVLMTKPKGPAPHEIVIAEDWERRQVGMDLQKQDRVKLYRQEMTLKEIEKQRQTYA